MEILWNIDTVLCLCSLNNQSLSRLMILNNWLKHSEVFVRNSSGGCRESPKYLQHSSCHNWNKEPCFQSCSPLFLFEIVITLQGSGQQLPTQETRRSRTLKTERFLHKTYKPKEKRDCMRQTDRERERVIAEKVFARTSSQVSSIQVTVAQHVTRNLTTRSWYSKMTYTYTHLVINV